VFEWSVQNVADTEWWVNEKFGARTMLVPHGSRVGARVHVLEPGEPMTLYHRESEQEGFLVVEGECLRIVEGEERPLRRWDYFHCAPGTTHSFVGAGDGPCVMVTVGARTEDGTIPLRARRGRAAPRRRSGDGDGHPCRGVRPVPEVGVRPPCRLGLASLEPLR
jgi:uncharacterized cupin superfamily protein